MGGGGGGVEELFEEGQRDGLVAASRARQVSLASKVIKPASACTCRHPGENTGSTNNKIYRAHTRGDPACGAFNHVISLPEESIKKPGEPRRFLVEDQLVLASFSVTETCGAVQIEHRRPVDRETSR
ncbi:unnamed protein product [Leuciscus chuanchicus]